MEKANIKDYFLFGEEYYPTLQYDCNLFDDNTTGTDSYHLLPLKKPPLTIVAGGFIFW